MKSLKLIHKLSILIRSTVFNLYMYTWTFFVCGLAAFGLLIFRSNSYASKVTYIWSKGIIKGLELICKLDFKVIGTENLPKGPFIAACSHQSAWETIFFLMYFKNPIYVLKKEVTYIPLLGWYPKAAGMGIIDRDNRVNALFKVIKSVSKALEQKRAIVIFPEGTRVPLGHNVEYKSGIAALYNIHGKNYPIIPVALNSGVFWGRNSWIKYPGSIIVEFLKPIEQNLNKTEFLFIFKSRLNSARDKLVSAAKDYK